MQRKISSVSSSFCLPSVRSSDYSLLDCCLSHWVKANVAASYLFFSWQQCAALQKWGRAELYSSILLNESGLAASECSVIIVAEVNHKLPLRGIKIMNICYQNRHKNLQFSPSTQVMSDDTIGAGLIEKRWVWHGNCGYGYWALPRVIWSDPSFWVPTDYLFVPIFKLQLGIKAGKYFFPWMWIWFRASCFLTPSRDQDFPHINKLLLSTSVPLYEDLPLETSCQPMFVRLYEVV